MKIFGKEVPPKKKVVLGKVDLDLSNDETIKGSTRETMPVQRTSEKAEIETTPNIRQQEKLLKALLAPEEEIGAIMGVSKVEISPEERAQALALLLQPGTKGRITRIIDQVGNASGFNKAQAYSTQVELLSAEAERSRIEKGIGTRVKTLAGSESIPRSESDSPIAKNALSEVQERLGIKPRLEETSSLQPEAIQPISPEDSLDALSRAAKENRRRTQAEESGVWQQAPVIPPAEPEPPAVFRKYPRGPRKEEAVQTTSEPEQPVNPVTAIVPPELQKVYGDASVPAEALELYGKLKGQKKRESYLAKLAADEAERKRRENAFSKREKRAIINETLDRVEVSLKEQLAVSTSAEPLSEPAQTQEAIASQEKGKADYVLTPMPDTFRDARERRPDYIAGQLAALARKKSEETIAAEAQVAVAQPEAAAPAEHAAAGAEQQPAPELTLEPVQTVVTGKEVGDFREGEIAYNAAELAELYKGTIPEEADRQFDALFKEYLGEARKNSSEGMGSVLTRVRAFIAEQRAAVEAQATAGQQKEEGVTPKERFKKRADEVRAMLVGQDFSKKPWDGENPVDEAEVYMAYSREKQAFEVLEDAVRIMEQQRAAAAAEPGGEIEPAFGEEVSMPEVGEEHTPREWRERLSGLIGKFGPAPEARPATPPESGEAKPGFKERMAYLLERGKKIEKASSKWIEEYFGTLGERYNKLPTWQKITLGGALAVGFGLTSSIPAVLYGTALIGTRVASLAGAFRLNQEKLDRISRGEATGWWNNCALNKWLASGTETERKNRAMAKSLVISFGLMGGAYALSQLDVPHRLGSWLYNATHEDEGLTAVQAGVATSGAGAPAQVEVPADAPPAVAPEAALSELSPEELTQQQEIVDRLRENGNTDISMSSTKEDIVSALAKEQQALEIARQQADELAKQQQIINNAEENVRSQVRGAAEDLITKDAVQAPAAAAAEIPTVAVKSGQGYEWMAKRMWEQLQEKGLDPSQYAEGSDVHKLLDATPETINKVIHDIAKEHGFFNPDGTSAQINLGSQMTIGGEGELRINYGGADFINRSEERRVGK